jgi:hypothetical protein
MGALKTEVEFRVLGVDQAAGVELERGERGRVFLTVIYGGKRWTIDFDEGEAVKLAAMLRDATTVPERG